MKRILTTLMVLVLFVTSVPATLAVAGINRKINFQGKVVNKGVGSTDGTNVTDGNYDFSFTLWSTLSAGTSLWTETWSSGTTQVSVNSGIFQVALGTYKTFPPTVDFNSDSLYLSVNYNGDGDMTPRIQMAAVPYAFNAEKVGGLTVTNTTGTLTIPNGKTIVFGDNFATTGVGISINQSLLTTDMVGFGGLSIGGSVSITTNLSVGGSVAFTNLPIGAGTTILYINSSGNLVQGTLPAGSTPYTATNGLNLNGSAFGLGGTLTSNTQIGISSFDLSFLRSNGESQLFLESDGDIGIGRSSPDALMHLYKADDLNVNLQTEKGFIVDILYYVGGTAVAEMEFDSNDLTNTFEIGTVGDYDMFFKTNGSEKMRIKSGGDVSINTNLSVGGSLVLTALPVGVGTSALYIDSSGNVVKGTMPDTGVGKSKVITLSPEFHGASLSADGSGTTDVAMTSDNTLNAGGVGWKNYYELSSTNAALQDYSVIVRVNLPADFDTWETGSCPGSTCALEFNYQTGVGATGDNAISYIISNDTDTPGTAVCSIGSTANTAWGASGCTEAVLNDGGAPEWDAANETAVVRIKMAAKNTASALVRAGDIVLRYKAKF